MALNLGLYKNPQYTAADFTPIGLMASFSYTLVARKDLPQNTLKEVITYAQQNPAKLSLATGGAGSGQHVAGVLFKQLAKVDIVEIPYKGAQPAYTDMLGGRVDLFFDNTTTAQPLIEAGRIKPLATSGTRREQSMPQIPTAREAGVDGLEMESWIGIFASAKTPAPVLEKLRVGLAKVTAQPELRQRLEKGGWRMMGMSVAEAESYARAEADKWTRFLKQAGISGD
jgi:tripartite-type tricarboxylate transporter receptor subunit TctC